MAEKEIKGIKKFLEEFKAFAMRGNVLDMAVGVVIGSAAGGTQERLRGRAWQHTVPVH